MKHSYLSLTITAVAMAYAASGWAAHHMGEDGKAQMERHSEQDDVYGSQLMTDQERTEYRAKMRALNTEAEREALRREHHEKMKRRAQEQGVTLPDEPPAQRRGGMGGRAGSGMGGTTGSGMGGTTGSGTGGTTGSGAGGATGSGTGGMGSGRP